MKKAFKKTIISILIFSFGLSNSAYSFGNGRDALRAKASVRTSAAGSLQMSLFEGTEDSLAEGAFIFCRWGTNPGLLASGRYADLRGSRTEPIELFNTKLNKIKRRLLKEEAFDEQDFEVNVEVIYPAYKAAAYKRQGDVVMLDKRCFENEDFLYFEVKHELRDRKLPDMPIIGKCFREYPGLRELFTLITVNIRGFMELRRRHPRRAKAMLDFCRKTGDPARGLLRCYAKIMADVSLNDAFTFTGDVFRLIENSRYKSYFPNTRKAVRRLAARGKEGNIDYETTAGILRPRLKAIYREYFEIESIRDTSPFSPLTDFKKNTPKALKPFMPYAKDVGYKLDNDSIFLRIRLRDGRDSVKFAYIYIGLKDNWYSVLGKRGRIYGLTYRGWKKDSPDLFTDKDYDAQTLRNEYWKRLIRLPVRQLIDELCIFERNRLNELEQMRSFPKEGLDAARGKLRKNRENLEKRFAGLFRSLGIKGELSRQRWIFAKNIAKETKVPNTYYVLRDIIWKHISRTYPNVFLGEEDLQGCSIARIPLGLITKDPNMGIKLLSFLNPRKKQIPPSFYKQAYRFSMQDILDMLEEQEEAASTRNRDARADIFHIIYKETIPLFPAVKSAASGFQISQRTQEYVYSAA